MEHDGIRTEAMRSDGIWTGAVTGATGGSQAATGGRRRRGRARHGGGRQHARRRPGTAAAAACNGADGDGLKQLDLELE